MTTPLLLPSESTSPSPNRQQKWFWVYAIGSSVLIVFLLLRHPDTSPRESLGDSKQRTAEIERQAQLARIDGLQRQISILQQSQVATEAEKAAFETKVKDYSMDHKLAILAIGGAVAGTAIAVDENGQFTSGQKTAAGWTAAAAAAYALFNHEEIIEVTDRMTKAATMISDYDSRLNQIRQQISSLQSQLDQARKP